VQALPASGLALYGWQPGLGVRRSDAPLFGAGLARHLGSRRLGSAASGLARPRQEDRSRPVAKWESTGALCPGRAEFGCGEALVNLTVALHAVWWAGAREGRGASAAGSTSLLIPTPLRLP